MFQKFLISFFPFLTTFDDGFYFQKIIDSGNWELIHMFLDNGAEITVSELKILLDKFDFLCLSLLEKKYHANIQIVSQHPHFKFYLDFKKNNLHPLYI